MPDTGDGGHTREWFEDIEIYRQEIQQPKPIDNKPVGKDAWTQEMEAAMAAPWPMKGV